MIIDRSKQQKNLLEMLQEKNEYISAPCNGNGICGKCIVRYKSGATEPTKQDREFLSEKQLEQGYRLACQSYPTEEYKVEIPELEETIEVLQQWENQRTEEILKNTAEGTAEKTENAIYGICIDIGTTTLAALLVNLKTEADCQTAVSVNHQRTYGADVISRIDASNNGKTGEENTIKKVGGKEETRRFLENLGFVVGGTVTVVSEIGGNMIVNIKDSRVAIGKDMANKIMV